jgi:hypothetical protein
MHDPELVVETNLYKIRLSKKSGMPDLDLPSLNESLILKDLNFLNFSIVVDSSLFLIVSKKKYSQSSINTQMTMGVNISLKTIKSPKKGDEGRSINIEQREPLLNTKNPASPQKNASNNNRSCCDCFVNLFKKKK